MCACVHVSLCVCGKKEQNKVISSHELLLQHHKLPRKSSIFGLFFQLNEIINLRGKKMGETFRLPGALCLDVWL